MLHVYILFVLVFGCIKSSAFAFDQAELLLNSDSQILNSYKEFGDILRNDYTDFFRESRNEELGNTVDVLVNDPMLTSVTDEFGSTIITARNFPYQSAQVTSDKKPWSSWWYPKRENYLFEDTNTRMAPLNKYDLYRKLRGKNSGSAAAFEAKGYDPRSQFWEGLCDAWSLASLNLPEPKKPITFKFKNGKSVKFEISDLKVLLLKTYEAVSDSSLKYYGQKFNGNFDGWIYPDLYPEQFHRFVEVQLFEKRQPFMMDHDPGVQVWNVPVYKANYTLSEMPGDTNALAVRMWLYSAEPTKENEKDFVGTKEAVREYNYVLKGKRNSEGSLVIDSGYWVKANGIDSRKSHPDYFVKIPENEKLVRKSWNSEIDVDLVDEILSKSF